MHFKLTICSCKEEDMGKLRFTLCLIAMALMLSVAGQASANLIQNGSFEDPTYGGDYWGLNSTNNQYTITDWTLEFGSVDLVHHYWAAADGAQSLDMSGTGSAGYISQSFGTVAGTSYVVTFALSGNFVDGVDTSRSLTVGIAGVDSADYTFDYAEFDRPQSASDYTLCSWVFTAVSDSSTLYFLSLEDELSSYGAILDNVSVSATPIPGAVWLLGSGIVGLIGVRRRMKA